MTKKAKTRPKALNIKELARVPYRFKGAATPRDALALMELLEEAEQQMEMAPRGMGKATDYFVHSPGKRGFWSVTQPMFVSSGFSELMVLMSKEHPGVQVRAEDVLAPAGFLLLEEPLQPEVFPSDVKTPIRAISWQTSLVWRHEEDADGQGLLIAGWEWGQILEKAASHNTEAVIFVVLWSESGNNGKQYPLPLVPTLVIRAPCHLPSRLPQVGIGLTHELVESVELPLLRRQVAGLLASITAASRSTYTSSEALPVRASRILPGSSRTTRKQRTVRTSYISAPQFVKAEKDSRTGRKVALHFVRGHWKKQWYASQGAHHAVWIDGYFRGDPQRGEISGPVVLVGSAEKRACGEELHATREPGWTRI